MAARPLSAGQFGAWTPIGAEQTASGYEVAWKVSGADQYTVWNTDSSGNYVSTHRRLCREPAPRWKSLETSFHQDLNGDGVIGIPTPVMIEAFGSTSLVQVGNNFYLDNISSGTGPELKFGGAAVVGGAVRRLDADRRGADGERLRGRLEGPWRRSVYGLEYRQQRQLHLNLSASVSGTSAALESLETSFHQDLNGDGVIGVPDRP